MKKTHTQQSLHTILALGFFISHQLLAVDWTPSEISTALWFDAADASTITSDPDGVSLWLDKSGNRRDATQTNALAKPDTGGTHNSLNVVNLDGSSEFFQLGTGLDWLAGGGGNATHTTFAVMRVTNFSNLYGAATAAGANDARLHVGFRSAADYRINRWANDYYPPTTNLIPNQFNLLRWTWIEGGAKSVYANAREEGTGTSGGGIGSSLQPMNGGGRIGNIVGQGFIGGDLAEMVMIAGPVEQEVTDLMEGYLAWKWGEQDNLPDDHPYKNAAPQGEGSGGIAITEISYSETSREVTLTWNSVATESYVIRYSTDLADWSGSVPGGSITAAGDETTSVIDLSATGLSEEEKVFFRIEVE